MRIRVHNVYVFIS